MSRRLSEKEPFKAVIENAFSRRHTDLTNFIDALNHLIRRTKGRKRGFLNDFHRFSIEADKLANKYNLSKKEVKACMKALHDYLEARKEISGHDGELRLYLQLLVLMTDKDYVEAKESPTAKKSIARSTNHPLSIFHKALALFASYQLLRSIPAAAAISVRQSGEICLPSRPQQFGSRSLHFDPCSPDFFVQAYETFYPDPKNPSEYDAFYPHLNAPVEAWDAINKLREKFNRYLITTSQKYEKKHKVTYDLRTTGRRNSTALDHAIGANDGSLWEFIIKKFPYTLENSKHPPLRTTIIYKRWGAFCDLAALSSVSMLNLPFNVGTMTAPISFFADEFPAELRFSFLERLLKHGADVKATGIGFHLVTPSIPVTLLERYCRTGNVPLVELLIQKGAMISRLAMSWAVGRNNLAMVELFLKNGYPVLQHKDIFIELARVKEQDPTAVFLALKAAGVLINGERNELDTPDEMGRMAFAAKEKHKLAYSPLITVMLLTNEKLAILLVEHGAHFSWSLVDAAKQIGLDKLAEVMKQRLLQTQQQEEEAARQQALVVAPEERVVIAPPPVEQVLVPTPLPEIVEADRPELISQVDASSSWPGYLREKSAALIATASAVFAASVLLCFKHRKRVVQEQRKRENEEGFAVRQNILLRLQPAGAAREHKGDEKAERRNPPNPAPEALPVLLQNPQNPWNLPPAPGGPQPGNPPTVLPQMHPN